MSFFDKAKELADKAKEKAALVAKDIQDNREEYLDTAKKAGKAAGGALMSAGNAVEKKLDALSKPKATSSEDTKPVKSSQPEE